MPPQPLLCTAAAILETLARSSQSMRPATHGDRSIRLQRQSAWKVSRGSFRAGRRVRRLTKSWHGVQRLRSVLFAVHRDRRETRPAQSVCRCNHEAHFEVLRVAALRRSPALSHSVPIAFDSSTITSRRASQRAIAIESVKPSSTPRMPSIAAPIPLTCERTESGASFQRAPAR